MGRSNEIITCNVLPYIAVYMVVMHLKDTLTLGEFLMSIRHLPVALSLYIKVTILSVCLSVGLSVCLLVCPVALTSSQFDKLCVNTPK